jgi:hypothetical protein
MEKLDELDVFEDLAARRELPSGARLVKLARLRHDPKPDGRGT